MVARLQGILSSASCLGYQVILAGDLNEVFNPLQDRIPGHMSSVPDTHLMRFLAGQELMDTYRVVHPNESSMQSMTRVDPADLTRGSRIDYILASRELAL